MSELAVSNDVLRESLRMPEPPSLSTWLEQQLSVWFPTFERRLIEALYWFADRRPWQRGLLSMGVGVVLGLGIVFAAAGVLHSDKRGEVVAATPAPRAVSTMPVAAQMVAPLPPPPAVIAPVAAPVAVSVAQPPAPEQTLEQPESKPLSKRAKKRHLRHHKASANAGGWSFPRPQRRSL